MVNLTGAYVGLVEKNDDPEKLGRLKVRVPHAYGATGSNIGTISTNNLPWALPSGLPQGGSASSGAINWLPEPGDQVIVWFLDGEPEKPVWSWMMQTRSQAKGYQVNKYSDQGGTVGKPSRAALTRYGHTVEFNLGSIINTTSAGYRVVLTDSSTALSQDGKIQVSTPKGNFLEIDDQTSTMNVLLLEDVYFNATQLFSVICETLDLVTTNGDANLLVGDGLFVTSVSSTEFEAGGDFKATTSSAMTLDAATTFGATVGTSATITAPLVEIKGDITNIGVGSLEPYVGGTQMLSLLTALVIYLDTHTHGNGNNGSPTSPPIVPSSTTITPKLSSLVSTTLFGSM